MAEGTPIGPADLDVFEPLANRSTRPVLIASGLRVAHAEYRCTNRDGGHGQVFKEWLVMRREVEGLPRELGVHELRSECSGQDSQAWGGPQLYGGISLVRNALSVGPIVNLVTVRGNDAVCGRKPTSLTT